MNLILILIINCFFCLYKAENVTRFQRKNIFLSRRKRFVQWPKGSNFVINFTCTKPLLRYQPLTWNTVYEMDVPFAVPPDNRIFFNPTALATKTKRHVLERKYLFEHLEDFMSMMGIKGSACINRLLCDSEDFLRQKDKSLIRDLIKVLFRSFIDDPAFSEYKDKCKEEHFTSCPVSLLDIFLNSSNDHTKNSFNVDSNSFSVADQLIAINK